MPMRSPQVMVVAFATMIMMGCHRDPVISETERLHQAAVGLLAEDLEWSRCLEENENGSDSHSIDCNTITNTSLVKLMGQVLAARKASLSAQSKKYLEKAQANWRNKMESKCQSDPYYRSEGGGTAYPGTAALVDYGFCTGEATKKRIATLIVAAP